MHPAVAIYGLWIVWFISWMAASGWSSSAETSIGMRAALRYRALMIVGGLVLGIPAHGYEGALRLWHVGWVGAWICVGIEALGFAFCWWARLHLGRLWSGNITRKPDHRIVDTGPYGLVRHPIYTGIIIALLATVAAKGTILAIVGAALIIAGVWVKARLEEGWLRSELGPDAYDAYRRRVPMLMPFGPVERS